MELICASKMMGCLLAFVVVTHSDNQGASFGGHCHDSDCTATHGDTQCHHYQQMKNYLVSLCVVSHEWRIRCHRVGGAKGDT